MTPSAESVDALAAKGAGCDPMPREWRGYVVAHRGWLYIRVKGPSGWQEIPARERDTLEGRAKADRKRDELREKMAVQEGVTGGGPVTVRAWADRWREVNGRPKDDEIRLRLHVLPAIGSMLLADVRPRHIKDMIRAAWKGESLAPKTVLNTYGVVQALFRDAAIEGLIDVSPCILRQPHLPAKEDRDPRWRAGAVFTRKELETLISPREGIEADSTIAYAILGLAGPRHADMARLLWRDYHPDVQPLGRLVFTETKTVKERWQAVHSTLAAVLAEWKLTGWAKLMKRPPTDDDWIVPPVADVRRKQLGRRTKSFERKRLVRHLENLGWRHRRVQDFRRTFISLATEDGSIEAIVKRGTHAAPRHIMGLYTSVEWEALCREVGKLQIGRLVANNVVSITGQQTQMPPAIRR